LEDAEDRLARLARLRPLSVSERVLRAQVARDRGRLDEAILALDDPTGREPRNGTEEALISAWRGWLEMQRHHLRAAELHLKHALDLQPTRGQARRQLIDLYALQGRFAEVTEHSKQLARSGAMDFTYLYIWTLREALDPAERAKSLEEAIKADPADRTSRLALSECLRRVGQLDGAEAVLKTLNHADSDVRATMAHIALDRGEISIAETLVTIGPNRLDDPSLAQLRGQLALLRDEPTVAKKQFEAALRAAPDSRESLFGLGQSLRLLNEPQAAAPYLKAAREVEHLEWLVRGAQPMRQKDPKALQEIGAACRDAGRREQAHAWYQLAASYDPNNPQLQAILAETKPES
jgi:tetratricopeptide (TPR) repeat protein